MYDPFPILDNCPKCGHVLKDGDTIAVFREEENMYAEKCVFCGKIVTEFYVREPS
jgi:Zn ribbon nucleic-acid-binding protein